MIARLLFLLSSLALSAERSPQELKALVGPKGTITHLYDLYEGQGSLDTRIDALGVRVDSLEAGSGGGGGNLDSAVILAPSDVARNRIQPTSGTNPGLAIRAHASQSANPFQFENSSGTAITYLEPDGDIVAVRPSTSGISPLVVQNSSNTTGGDVSVVLRNGGSSGGDAKVQFVTPSTQTWSIGLSRADNHALRIYASDDLASSSTSIGKFRLDRAGGGLAVGNGGQAVAHGINAGYFLAGSECLFTFQNRGTGATADAAVHIRSAFGGSQLRFVGEDTDNWAIGQNDGADNLNFVYRSDGSNVADAGAGPGDAIPSGQVQSMTLLTSGGIHIYNQSTPPATPTGGGVLFVDGGALKFIGSSGTVTTLAVP